MDSKQSLYYPWSQGYSTPSRRITHILTYEGVELATTDIQNILEIPATDEIHMEDRDHGLA